MRTDVVVVFSPVGGGHRAAAIAVSEAARARGLRVEMLDAFAYAPRLIGDAYVGAHLTGQSALPNFYGSAYFAANHRDGAFEPLRRGFDHLAFARLTEHVVDLAPRAVVATHHLPLVVLGRARRKGWLRAPLVGVITDYTSHAVWAEEGVDVFAVPCARARRELVQHGVRASDVELTGIPVRAAFGEIAGVRDPARGERLRVLVTCGGFGVGPMRRIVGSFAGVRDVELTVVCGSARGLARDIEEDAARAGVMARVIGFEKDMAARVAEVHLVVGKAGGLTVSETMTAGRPMVIVGAVPGNEKINEELVTAAGAGYAAAAHDVGARVSAMRGAREIAAMGARARALAILGSADRVVALALAHAASVRAA